MEGILVTGAVNRVREAVKHLHKAIEQFNQESAKYAKWMLRLTWAIVGLTIAMLFAVVVQIYVATSQPQIVKTETGPLSGVLEGHLPKSTPK